MYFRLCIAFNLLLSAVFAGENEKKFLINIEGLGEIEGSQFVTIQGKEFIGFRGIPYAEPPTGELRFKPPIPKSAWSNANKPFDATKEAAECFQYDALTRSVRGVEDCLTLNVYTDNADQESANRAVMIFIHGGGFTFGSGGSDLYGPRKILDFDVVLVTINYRLHSLGFLSTSDDSSPGNYGLFDQTEALRWVRKHIHAFGGDPDKITIFGESAGAASVFYHIISPLSKGLFHQAIAMSGNALCPWAFNSRPLSWTKKLAKFVGCQGESTKSIVTCLRKIPAEKLVRPIPKYMEEVIAPFSPVLDGQFVQDTPTNLLNSGQIANRVPIMMGVTKDEGIFYYSTVFGNKQPDIDDKTLTKILAQNLNIPRSEGIMPKLVKALRNQYLIGLDENTEVQEKKQKLIQIMSDGPFNAPHYQALMSLLNSGIEPFVYSYDYDSGHSFARMFGAENITGVGHAEDLYFQFDSPKLFPEFQNINDAEANKFLELWINFAKFGNPTPVNLAENSEMTPWLPSKREHIVRYHLGIPITTDVYKPDEDIHRPFWMEKIPAILQSRKHRIEDEL